MFMFMFMFMLKFYVNSVSDRNEAILGFVVISLSVVFHLRWSDRISWKTLLHRKLHAGREHAQTANNTRTAKSIYGEFKWFVINHSPTSTRNTFQKLICRKYFISLSFQIRLEFWFVEQTQNDNRNKNNNTEKHENNNEKLNHHNTFGMWSELEVVRLRNSSQFLFSRKSQAMKWSSTLAWPDICGTSLT